MSSFDLSKDEMRAMARAASEFSIDFIHALDDAPASNFEGAAEVARSIRDDIGEDGAPFEELLDAVRRGATHAANNAGPGFLAYIPGGGLYATAIADFLADSVNRYIGMWSQAPGLSQMEYNVVRWLCNVFGYGEDARGILTSGGSLANFEAIVTARRSILGEDFSDAVIYASEFAHHSLLKGAVLAGFPAANFRRVGTDEKLAMDPERLRAEIAQDRAAGKRPFLVIASAGTADTGAVEPIGALADVAAEHDLWLHVDGAYGGFFQLTDRGRTLFEGVERADSITVDPHKGLFLPYGTGALIVRDGERMREAHSIGAHYLQDLAGEADLPNFSEYSIELSRSFRGLRVWLPLRLHGVGAFRAALDEKLDLARHLYDALVATPGFEVPWEPELTVVPFRYVPESGDADDANRRLLELINGSKRVFMSSTMLHGNYMIRPCIVSHRTHRDRIDEAIEIIRSAAASL
ncbi:MAG TPA: pyridoxal-dependent decarboxylase [Actinomycetota bacterium]|jgi:aromatic-L-amino-acid decarboxylase